ncbi:MAG TPA: sigma-54 dependent transcriptional regulator [Gemmataceae bacterium]
MSTPSRSSIRLLVVDDDEQMRRTLVSRFERQGLTVTSAASGEEALAKAAQTRCDVALLDLHLPGIGGIELLARLKELQPELEALMLTAHSSIETAVLAMKRGAYDYLTKPFHLPELEVHIQKAFEKVQLARREKQWIEQLRYESPRHKLVGSSPAMRKVTSLIEKVALTDATVLVSGPSGTGKEVVARALHANSARRDRPLVTINCAALQETLLESELFGHEKGAFTGAVQTKSGLVEVAEGGTLFVDEIGEMAIGLQAKLLRVLEDGHYRRVGGTVELSADVRVVAATNRSLEEEIKAHRFREDLYYRLNVITVSLPPLRDRPQDIPELIEHFLTTRQLGPTRYAIQPDARDTLVRHEWPGNVRELANVLERAQILAEEHCITLDDLPESLVAARRGTPTGPEDDDPRRLDSVERRHVLTVLEQEKGNKVHAAKALGISRRALYRLLEKYQLPN